LDQSSADSGRGSSSRFHRVLHVFEGSPLTFSGEKIRGFRCTSPRNGNPVKKKQLLD
jgi:hypothetical protein